MITAAISAATIATARALSTTSGRFHSHSRPLTGVAQMRPRMALACDAISHGPTAIAHTASSLNVAGLKAPAHHDSASSHSCDRPSASVRTTDTCDEGPAVPTDVS